MTTSPIRTNSEHSSCFVLESRGCRSQPSPTAHRPHRTRGFRHKTARKSRNATTIRSFQKSSMGRAPAIPHETEID
jgi:hypothetical protein